MVFHRSLLRKPKNPKADIFWGYLKISSFMQNAIGSYICLDKICTLQSALQTCYKSVNILLALHICIIWIVQQLAELLVSAVIRGSCSIQQIWYSINMVFISGSRVIRFSVSWVLGFSGSRVLGFLVSRVLKFSSSCVLGLLGSRALKFWGALLHFKIKLQQENNKKN